MRSGLEEVVCWDLNCLTLIVRVNLKQELPGVGAAMIRVAEPLHASHDFQLLAFRVAADHLDASQAQPAKIAVWRWTLPPDADPQSLSRAVEFQGTLPHNLEMLDACFLGQGSTRRIVCWASNLELWDIDLGKESTERMDSTGILHPEEGDTANGSHGQLGKILGDRTAVASKALPNLLELPVRATASQQAGLTANLLGRVIPASAPSHNLPPPALIWAGFLATWGKPSQDAKPVAEPDLAQSATTSATHLKGKSADVGSEEVDLPSWAHRGPVLEETYMAEVVDAGFMDQLVNEVLEKP